jgi:hypothetical protein
VSPHASNAQQTEGRLDSMVSVAQPETPRLISRDSNSSIGCVANNRQGYADDGIDSTARLWTHNRSSSQNYMSGNATYQDLRLILTRIEIES